MRVTLFYFVGLTLFFERSHCVRMMKVIPGKPTIKFYDKQYIQDAVINTRRYGRKSDYVVNFEFTTLVTFGNNISISFIIYEFLHNEYRRSFVESHYSLCNLIIKDAYLGAVARRVGFTVCPVPPGTFHLMNMTFDQEFPNIMPFEKGRADLLVKLSPSQKVIGHLDVVLTFKQRVV